jgi:hypothetical protein
MELIVMTFNKINEKKIKYGSQQCIKIIAGPVVNSRVAARCNFCAA